MRGSPLSGGNHKTFKNLQPQKESFTRQLRTDGKLINSLKPKGIEKNEDFQSWFIPFDNIEKLDTIIIHINGAKKEILSLYYYCFEEMEQVMKKLNETDYFFKNFEYNENIRYIFPEPPKYVESENDNFRYKTCINAITRVFNYHLFSIFIYICNEDKQGKITANDVLAFENGTLRNENVIEYVKGDNFEGFREECIVTCSHSEYLQRNNIPLKFGNCNRQRKTKITKPQYQSFFELFEPPKNRMSFPFNLTNQELGEKDEIEFQIRERQKQRNRNKLESQYLTQLNDEQTNPLNETEHFKIDI
jgi:hypothetical protein